MDVPPSQPFPPPPSLPHPFPPLLPAHQSMAFRILSMSAIPLLVFLVFICACITRIFKFGYNDHETAAETDNRDDPQIQLRSHHSERIRELMQRIKEIAMEASDGFVYDQAKGISGGEGGEKSITTTTQCAICLEDFKDGDVCRALPECDHVFHKECVVSWLIHSNSCPLCRAFATVFVPWLPV